VNDREHASDISSHYNAIAHIWDEELKDSSYGTDALRRAIQICGIEKKKRTALDIGCGSGGRLIRLMESHAFQVTGLDCSSAMLDIAHKHHPAATFIHADITEWNTSERFDLIIAWDSIFHVAFDKQELVLTKLMSMLKNDGVLLYTIGDEIGEHISEWHERPFYYSSLGIEENIKILQQHACRLRHLELDQFPLKHCMIIAQKDNNQ
jgi:predicted TPR repeat methyltransferase